MVLADPVLTANIYCDRGLDALIHGAITPFRARLRDSDPGGGWSLWLVRYSRCGEHLKVRLHGHPERRELARRLLEESVQAYFAGLPPVSGEVRISRMGAPPIDVEDDATSDYPDRTLLWTRYRRSHVNLGPPLFLEDDWYTALFTACLGSGADLVLDFVQPDQAGKVPGAARQRGLLRAIFGGLAAVGFSPDERAAYLAYHRDWLVRFNVAGPEAEAELLASYDRRAEGMASTLEQLRQIAGGYWGAAPGSVTGADADWRDALSALVEYLARFRGNPEYRLDPFTDDPVFPPLFKAFHALANHLGIGMLDEALVHHLVLRATATQVAGTGKEAVV
ncbi:MAG TPA: lantibiotic dehydratase C-terminal domain-containing protein [Longimicrobium sp.]|jgi:hypothetical protein|uniref:lantibiotic dehydratase C-terminal domain-containing protein n=1 Tax=Longimicrobium sp. TaxID=2029185 RepID=UPI002ED8F65C